MSSTTFAMAIAAIRTARQIMDFASMIAAGDDLTPEQWDRIIAEARLSDARFDERVEQARRRLDDGDG